MNSIGKTVFAAALLLTLLGCASVEEGTSSLPWNRPAPWETGLPVPVNPALGY